jgi:hypothetical protein
MTSRIDLLNEAETEPKPDCVDIASEHSFPSSDPPAWIFRGNPLPKDDDAESA